MLILQCASEKKRKRPNRLKVAIKCVYAWAICRIPWLDIILHSVEWGWIQTITIKLNECTHWRRTFRYIYRESIWKDSRTKTNRKCLWRRCFLWFFFDFFPLLSIFYSIFVRWFVRSFSLSIEYNSQFFLFFRSIHIHFIHYAHALRVIIRLFTHFKNILSSLLFLPQFICPFNIDTRWKRWVKWNKILLDLDSNFERLSLINATKLFGWQQNRRQQEKYNPNFCGLFDEGKTKKTRLRVRCVDKLQHTEKFVS